MIMLLLSDEFVDPKDPGSNPALNNRKSNTSRDWVSYIYFKA